VSEPQKKKRKKERKKKKNAFSPGTGDEAGLRA
jgi:hypothetical protein